MGRAQVLPQRGRAAQDAHGEQAEAPRVDECARARDPGQGRAVGLCEGLEGGGREHVCHYRSGHIGAEGVRGEEDGWDAALSGESVDVKSIKGRGNGSRKLGGR